LTPEQILSQQAHIARANRARSLVQQQQAEANRTQLSATLLQFDAASGLWLCQLPDGSRVYARSITNSGGKGRGSVVSLSKNGTAMPTIKFL